MDPFKVMYKRDVHKCCLKETFKRDVMSKSDLVSQGGCKKIYKNISSRYKFEKQEKKKIIFKRIYVFCCNLKQRFYLELQTFLMLQPDFK